MARSKIGAALIRERPKSHGSFDKVATTSAIFMNALRGTVNWDRMGPAKQMALQELVHKLARIGHGDHDHPDHWADIAGYGELGHNACTAAQEEAAKAARKRGRKVSAAKPAKKTAKKAKKAKKVVKRPASPIPAAPRQADEEPARRPSRQRTRRPRDPEAAPTVDAAA